jgi:hypothetical protein
MKQPRVRSSFLSAFDAHKRTDRCVIVGGRFWDYEAPGGSTLSVLISNTQQAGVRYYRIRPCEEHSWT